MFKQGLYSDFCRNDLVFTSTNDLFAPQWFCLQIKDKFKTFFFKVISFALSVLEAVDFTYFNHRGALFTVFSGMIHVNDGLDFISFRIHQVKSQAGDIIFGSPFVKIVDSANDLETFIGLVQVGNQQVVFLAYFFLFCGCAHRSWMGRYQEWNGLFLGWG